MPSRCGHRTTLARRHVLVRVHRHRFLPRGEASLEVSDVSREFPHGSVLKFSMSVRRDDTLRYKIGCRLLRLRRVLLFARLSTGPAMSIEKELPASIHWEAQNIWSHAIRSQSEARYLLVGKGALGGPFVFLNDTRIAQDSLFRVTSLKRSNRKESGIRLPFRLQADLDEPTTFCKSRYSRSISTRLCSQTDFAGFRM